ncbi:hypothetical protein EV182_004625 [Spiromyces aspiralis]|uniref:Uncharacterized protein n=1 Tax=Spiromyces aspiralis TaxID=68401 RepID=A0ACC1HSU8_9FUNG|nr:hypothetical protein EV182_004625 [Spiromyces aspiralis]
MDQAAASSKDSLGSKKSKKRKGRNKRRALPVTSALSDIKTGVSRKSYFGKNSKFNVLQKHSDLDNNASTVPGSLKSTNDDLRAVMRDESLSKNSHTTEASVEQNDAVEAKASLDENSMMLPMDILTQLGKPKHKKGYETGSSPLMHSRKKRRLDIQGRSKDTELSSSQRMVNEIRVQALGESANNKVAVFAANDDTSKASRFKQEQMFGGHIKRDSPLKTISKRRLSSVPQFATVVPFASSP